MNIEVGSQILAGQVADVTLDTATGNIVITLPEFGDANGPETVSVLPGTTKAGAEAIIAALVPFAPKLPV